MATDPNNAIDTTPETPPAAEPAQAPSFTTDEQLAQPARRAFIGRSGKLLIYTPPIIQLFIPTRALAASPSS